MTPPPAPTLDPIDNADLDGDFWVVWDEVPNGVTYTLEEDASASFTSPVERYAGPGTEMHIEGQAAGIWFYRVRAAGGRRGTLEQHRIGRRRARSTAA